MPRILRKILNFWRRRNSLFDAQKNEALRKPRWQVRWLQLWLWKETARPRLLSSPRDCWNENDVFNLCILSTVVDPQGSGQMEATNHPKNSTGTRLIPAQGRHSSACQVEPPKSVNDKIWRRQIRYFGCKMGEEGGRNYARTRSIRPILRIHQWN